MLIINIQFVRSAWIVVRFYFPWSLSFYSFGSGEIAVEVC